MEPIMANKTKAKKTPKQPIFSDTLRALISSASVIGFVVADSFGEALTLVESIITETKGKVALRDKALNAAQANYVPGYVARSLLRLPDYRSRWDNLTQDQQIDMGKDICAKSHPTTKKAKPEERRTDNEHKACRAADESWRALKRKAGIEGDKAKDPKKNSRAPRAGSNPPPPPPPVDLVKASPKIDKAYAERAGVKTVKEAVNDYYATAAAALLAFTNKNARNVIPQLSSATADFHAAVKAALGDVPSE
jgi:hypothetical protein